MKRYTFILFAAAFGVAVSCTRETEIEPVVTSAGYELLLRTGVDGMAAGATRAVGDDVPDITGLQEDAVNTLDVYVSGIFKGESAPSVRGFHLTSGNHLLSIDEHGTQTWRITPDWRKDFVPDNEYTFYVAANSSKVKTAAASGDPTVATTTLSGLGITSLDDLGNAIEFDYNPAEGNPEGGQKPFWGANNDDGVNPAWLDVHKIYSSSNESDISDAGEGDDHGKGPRYFTHNKSFLMNGTGTFTIPSSPGGDIAVTPSVTLDRAASKITLHVSFDASFLQRKSWVPSGAPQWRFFNFAFNTPVFSDLTQASTYDPTVSHFTSGANLIGFSDINDDILVYDVEDNYSFDFFTYCYPLSWTSATVGEEAPAIILSIGYMDNSTSSVTYHAYKIPVVSPDEEIYSLDRNKIYTINALISSEGSTLVTDAYPIDATYSIKEWTSVDAAPVTERDNSYIDVIPDAIAEPSGTQKVTDVIIRGNGEHTFRLEVLKPKTKHFDIAYYAGTTQAGATYEDPFGQTATPTPYPLTGDYTDEKGNTYTGCAASGALVPYYINLNGVIRNTIGNAPAPATNSIQNCFVKEDDEHLLIISEALPNKGVKYMKIRIYLTEDTSKYMDVNIRHYPTDAIMSKKGHWASRQSAAYTANKITEDERIGGPEELFAGMNSHMGAKTDAQGGGGDETSYDHTDYDSWNGYKYWVWVLCEETDTGDKELRHNFEITQDVYKSHTSDGTVNGTAEPGFEKHIDTDPYNYPLYFIMNEGVRDGVLVNASDGQTRMLDIGNATSEGSALQPRGTEDHKWYYWGVPQNSPVNISNETNWTQALQKANTINGGNIDYLYRQSIDGTYHYYGRVFAERHRVYYTGDQWVRKQYYHVKSNFQTWPNWALDYGDSYKSFKVGMYHFGSNTYGYPARIADDDTHWYHFEGGAETSGYSLSSSTIGTISAKNRQMYILQLSETSTQYTIGRPVLDESSFSDDEVVSPAFMIASQLGFLNSDMILSKLPDGSPNLSNARYAKYWAAAHCASYLEVDTKGEYYYGWRLPTKKEIEVMIEYQGDGTSATLVSGCPVSNDDRVMKPVLEAGYYFALNGDLVDNTAYSNGTNKEVTVRCVRDLTPEEIEAINK